MVCAKVSGGEKLAEEANDPKVIERRQESLLGESKGVESAHSAEEAWFWFEAKPFGRDALRILCFCC